MKKQIPKKSFPRNKSKPVSDDEARDKAGMGRPMMGKRKRPMLPPPPPPPTGSVQAGGTGPGFSRPGGY